MSLIERGINEQADALAELLDAGLEIGAATATGAAQEIVRLERRLQHADESLDHLASPNWSARPTGADAQSMAGFAADALKVLRGDVV